MTNLIVETDIGRDPDDFFALCYLFEAGVNLRAITISPGDPDQVAVAKFFLKECGLDIPVGVGSIRDKSSVGGVHIKLLNKYNFPTRMALDGLGKDIIKNTLSNYPDCELLVIGPLQSVGGFLRENPDFEINKATMQGGYVSYEDLESAGVHPSVKLEKFIGKKTVATFNLNGDVKGGELFLRAKIKDRRFVSKNLCHTIVYDNRIHKLVSSVKPKTRGGELLREGMSMYLENHHEGKKFHDPTAAVCHLHPEIATWVSGELYREKGGYGTIISENGSSRIVANIDRNKLWEYIAEGK